MGVHIDHRGGYSNYLTIQREIIMAASPRDDDQIRGYNTDEEFSPFSFSVGKLLPTEKRGNWLKFISEGEITQGSWEDYMKASVLRMQDYFSQEKLSGMDFVVEGNIPMGSGLSSSSALVVASALGFLELNGLRIPRAKLVNLCAEGEWYVGTRGGAGDHAAMLFGKRNYVTHARFFPFEVSDFVAMPDDYEVVMCNSLREAKKSASAKDVFNQRIASYEIGVMLIKNNFPSFGSKILHLRDVNEKNLRVGTDFIYDMVKSLPLKMDRDSCLSRLPEKRDELEQIFRTHEEPSDGYNVRGVCLFGIAECKRAEICADLLKKGDIEAFGKLMYVSHDGDRVYLFGENDEKKKWESPVSSEYLGGMTRKLRSRKAGDVSAVSLEMQPGAYRCSCEELDQLVDISKSVSGVVGSGLTGAGLGGCTLVLVRKDSVEGLLETVDEKFYHPRGVRSAAEVCIPVDGAGIL